MSDKLLLVGLDFECSGSSHDKHVPIQLGLVAENACYKSNIGGWDWNKHEWDGAAYNVHHISKADLKDDPPVSIVDGDMAYWLWNVTRGYQRMNVVPVGWNVGSYDMPYITKWMPLLRSLLSYRSVDLNALVFMLDGHSGKSWKDWKRAAKQYANEFIDETTRHDALTDAKAALFEFGFLRKQLA